MSRTGEVRERERFYRERGIAAVPSVIIAGRHLIQGGQPSEVFEQALRRIAAAEGVALTTLQVEATSRTDARGLVRRRGRGVWRHPAK